MSEHAPLYLKDRRNLIAAIGAAVAAAKTRATLSTPGKAAVNLGPVIGGGKSFHGVAAAKRQALKRRNRKQTLHQHRKQSHARRARRNTS